MNFTITLNGEGPELASALQVLRGVMDGQAVVSGEVSATIATPQTQQQEVIYQQQPVYQQPQYEQQQAPVYQQPLNQAPTQPVYQQQQPNQQAQQQGYQPQQQPTQPGGVPVSNASFSMDQLSVAATQLMDAGRQSDLLGLLAQFGVPALTMLAKEHYGTFANALRGLGAKI